MFSDSLTVTTACAWQSAFTRRACVGFDPHKEFRKVQDKISAKRQENKEAASLYIHNAIAAIGRDDVNEEWASAGFDAASEITFLDYISVS